MKTIELTKKQKKKLVSTYKNCKDACSFEPSLPNKSFTDPYRHFKSMVDDKISKMIK